MLVEISIVLIYLSFVLDFFVWPIASEVSTSHLIKSDQVSGHWCRLKLVAAHAVVLLLWVLPISAALYALAGPGNISGTPAAVAGLVLGLTGRSLTVLASLTLRRQGTESLNKHGVFSLTRHPVLVGLHITLAGLLMVLQSWLVLPGYLFSLVYFDRKLQQEESSLMMRFGDAYREYAEQTPRYLLMFK